VAGKMWYFFNKQCYVKQNSSSAFESWHTDSRLFLLNCVFKPVVPAF